MNGGNDKVTSHETLPMESTSASKNPFKKENVGSAAGASNSGAQDTRTTWSRMRALMSSGTIKSSSGK